MEQVYKTCMDKMGTLPINKDTHDRLNLVNSSIRAHQEFRVYLELKTLMDMTQVEIEYCKRFATKDNFYGDLLQNKEARFSLLKDIQEKLKHTQEW